MNTTNNIAYLIGMIKKNLDPEHKLIKRSRRCSRHLKGDHRMNQCRGKGFEGHHSNGSLAVMAWKVKKWVIRKKSIFQGELIKIRTINEFYREN
ncbi:MAG: hypothetical protein V2A69_02685 [Pseudomonadota bacterium]